MNEIKKADSLERPPAHSEIGLITVALAAIRLAVHGLQIIQMVSTTLCLRLRMVDVPTHIGIFTVGRLIHRVTELVLPVKIRILTRDDSAFVPDLINALLIKIAHSIHYFRFSSAVVSKHNLVRFKAGAITVREMGGERKGLGNPHSPKDSTAK